MADAPANASGGGGGLLDPRKAKAIFVLGVGLYLLMTFWSQAGYYNMATLSSKEKSLKQEKMRDLDKPVAPIEPQKPNEKSKDFAKLTDSYNKLKSTYDTKKKDYDDNLFPAYQNAEWKYDNEEWPETKEDLEELDKTQAIAEASLTRWAYLSFLGRFIAAVLMLIGLGFTAVNGSEWERAAAIVVIGLVLIGAGGVLGNMTIGQMMGR